MKLKLATQFCLMAVWAGGLYGSPAAPAKEPSAALELARQLNQAFVEVAEDVSPSVVVIQVAHTFVHPNPADMDGPFWDLLPREFRDQLEERWKKEQKKSQEKPAHREPVFDGQGSGVVIREDGYILTNRHVVEGAEKIRVRFRDGTEYDAEIRGEDAQSDIAVIKINAAKLKPAKLADSSKTRVGEYAIAIGAPFDLDYSVTFGHVSAKGRNHILQDMAMDQDFIQTDANINPGNSGGPLVNIYGEVIGINTLIRGLRTGIGFAIPSNLANEVAERLIEDGKYVRAWLGIYIQTLRDNRDYRDMFHDIKDGVVVQGIVKDGPARKSELRPNDVITSVDGKPVASAQELKTAVRSKMIGKEIVIDVQRLDADLKAKGLQIKITPEAFPEELVQMAARSEPVPEEKVNTMGLTVQALTKDLAEQFGVDKAEGVIVTEVEKDSLAESKAFQAGDIITDVNQKPVKTPKEFREAIKEGDSKKGIIINFVRRGTSKFEILKESGD